MTGVAIIMEKKAAMTVRVRRLTILNDDEMND